MSEKTPPSPFDLKAGVPPIEGELRPKPKAADRISKRVIAVAMGIVFLLAALFLVSLDQIDNKPAKPAKAEEKPKGTTKSEVAKAPEDLTGKTDPAAPAVGGGKQNAQPSSLVKTMSPQEILEKLRELNPGGLSDPAKAGAKPNSKKPDGSGVPAISGLLPKDGGGKSLIPPDKGSGAAGPLTPEAQALAQAKQERANRLRQAKSNGLSGKPFDDGSGLGAAPAAGAGVEAARAAIAQAAKAQAMGGAAPDQKKAGADGEQDEKLDFLKNAGKDDHSYHPHMPIAALSKNEVKMGSLVPLTLQQGINSDLPGQITARVSEGVYDSIEGCRLLIPPMTTAIGKYDSKVALGQSRILVVWNALIFPDGSELNLAGMQGYDTAGMAGLESDVDNHYLRLFGVGLGMSLVSATAQVVVPPTPQSAAGTTAAPSYGQSVATALAQQFGQLGGQIMGKYAAVQPTLRNYPGEQFRIMVPRTMMFGKVWAHRC